MRINKSLIAYTPTSGAGSGSVTSVALSAPTGFTVSGSPITTSGTLALSFTTGYGIPPLMTGNSGKFLTTNGTTMSWVNIAGTDVSGAALTSINDTNVQITLGGTPSTALLRAASLTMGWTGQLAVGRGGSGASTLTGVLVGNGTSAFTAVVGTAGQLLRRNVANTSYEFFTASLITGNGVTDKIAKWTSSTNLIDSIIGETGNAIDVSASVASTHKIANFKNTNASGFVSIGIDRPGSNRYSLIEHSTAGTTDWWVGTAYNAGGANDNYTIGRGINLSDAKFNVLTTGQIKLNSYVSTSSFTGIVQGYLAFTSGGSIITTATPGGVSGTQNYLAKFDSTGIAVGNSRIVDDGTNFLLNGASSVVTGLNLVGNFSATDSGGGAILLRRSAVPTSGQTLGLLDAYGITTGSTYQQGGGIEFRASQNWNSTSAGTELAIQTAPDNTIAPADMFVFLNNGAVRFIGRTSNPIGAAAGTMYYNSSANEMRYYNGTSWISF